MIKSIILQWEKNKHLLEEYFRETIQEEYSDYLEIVKKIFSLVITEADEEDWYKWDVENITEINNGDYQGTLLFIIPKDTYQPDVEDYIMTSVNYGSCSACDTLQSIPNDVYEKPTEEEIKEYMALALHLVQKTKKLN